jgi:hypothetical protein
LGNSYSYSCGVNYQPPSRKGDCAKRPLWGSKSALQKLLGRYIHRPPVSEEVVFIHEREFAKVSSLATQAAETDNEKFMSKEFVEFLKIQQRRPLA